jgi:hypothetical protein
LPPNKALQLTVKGRAAIDLWYPLAPTSGAPADLGRRPLPAAERLVRWAARMSSESQASDDWPTATSNGGPLLLVAQEYADAWLGTDPPKDGRVIQTRFRWNESALPCDYDRACDVDDYLGEITVGCGSGVILGDEPLATVWRPCSNAEGGVLVRCRFVESDEDWNRLLATVPDLDFELSSCTLEAPSGCLALFDSAFPGAGFIAEGAGSWVYVPPGLYQVGIREWQPQSDAAFLLHHLKASGARRPTRRCS